MENANAEAKSYYKTFRDTLAKHRYAAQIYFRNEKIYLYSCRKCNEEIRLNLDYDNEHLTNQMNLKKYMICSKCGNKKFKRIGERNL